MATDVVILDGEYVTYHARPGDVITWLGRNWTVRDTYPGYANLLRRDDPDGQGYERVSYRELKADNAFFAARLLPCRPPEGGVKL